MRFKIDFKLYSSIFIASQKFDFRIWFKSAKPLAKLFKYQILSLASFVLCLISPSL